MIEEVRDGNQFIKNKKIIKDQSVRKYLKNKRILNNLKYLEEITLNNLKYLEERSGDIQAYQDQAKLLAPLIKSVSVNSALRSG